MSKQDRIGSFELLVMLAVLRLGEDAYGVTISREIETRLKGRRVAVGSVYAALERLEGKGWVASDLGEATPVRGGKAKTYFRLTAKGVREVRSTHSAIASFWNSIPGFSEKSP
jgi:PadR family transcriptional regulator PadR